VWERKAVAGVEMGFGTRERGGQCRFMHTECIPTHSDASHAWTIDL